MQEQEDSPRRRRQARERRSPDRERERQDSERKALDRERKAQDRERKSQDRERKSQDRERKSQRKRHYMDDDEESRRKEAIHRPAFLAARCLELVRRGRSPTNPPCPDRRSPARSYHSY